MTSFVILVVLLAVLLFFSTFVKKYAFSFFYQLTRKQSIAVTLFSLLFYPGVVVHELSHLVAAVVLFVRVHDLVLIPKVVEGKIRGGSVVIEKVDVFRRTLVGIAPLFGGLMVMWLIVRYLLPKASFLCHAEFTGPEYARGISASRILNQVQNDIFCSKLELPFTIDHLLLTVVSLYLIFSISATMYSSKKDLEAMYYSVPVLFIIVLLLYIVGVQFSFLLDALTYFASGISQLNVVLILSLILNGVFFGGIAVLTKLFLRR